MSNILNEDSNSDIPKKSVLWSKDYILLIIANTFTGFSMNMIFSILSVYYLSLKIPLTVVGVLVGLFAIVSMLTRPLAGITADRFNKRNVLMIFSFMMGLCVFGYAFTIILPLMFIFRFFHGIAFGMSGTATFALGSTYMPKDRIGEGIGYLTLGYIFASAVAPGIGITTSELFGYPATFVIAGSLAAIGALVLIPLKTVKAEKISSEDRPKIKIKSLVATEALFPALLSALLTFGGGTVSTFLLVVADARGVKNIGVYYIVCAIFMFLARPITGKIFDKKGIAVLLYPSFAVAMVTMVLIGLSNSLWLFLVAGAFLSFAQGAVGPALQAECIRRTGVSRTGVANSTYFMGLDISIGISPVIGAVIATYFKYAAMFYFCSFLLLLAMVLFYLYSRKNKLKDEDSELYEKNKYKRS